jgi:hypothetical protein
VADAPTFGAFALVYASVVLIQGAVDGLIGEPFAVLHSDSAPEEAKRALRQAAGAALAGGTGAAGGLAVGAALGLCVLGVEYRASLREHLPG